MSFEFDIVAPTVILEKYRDLFEAKGIFYANPQPVGNSTNVTLEDSNSIYLDEKGWIAQISVLVGHILSEERMTFESLSKNKVRIYQP